MKLLIAIPALDEEASIREIIEESLAARDTILAESPVTEIEITVVSDGSTDRTVEYAREFEDRIKVIVFEKNRGYGAAIAEAWNQSDAELLSFLDADGTCDPRIFARLCKGLIEEGADVALGCRLNKESHMPLVRRIGNTFFAGLVSLLAFRRVRDVASGMRVVRHSRLPLLYPLPVTLDFTPAMSARAIFSPALKIIEVDMPYHERAGESKLHPIKDGLRFLRVILRTAFLYRPSRPLGLVGGGMLLMAALMMVTPARFYLQSSRLEEWMIYRFLVAEMISTIAVLLVCAGHLGSKAAHISLYGKTRLRATSIVDKFMSSRLFWLLPLTLMVSGGILVWDALMDYLSTGEVYEHWSRFIAMRFCFSIMAILTVARLLDYCLELLAERLHYLRDGAGIFSERHEP